MRENEFTKVECIGVKSAREKKCEEKIHFGLCEVIYKQWKWYEAWQHRGLSMLEKLLKKIKIFMQFRVEQGKIELELNQQVGACF